MESNRQVVIHMNHKDEPRKFTPGSRTPQERAKAAESESRPTVVGFDIGPAGSAWTTCREVTPLVPAEVKSSKGRGDGPRGLPAPDQGRKLQSMLYRRAKSDNYNAHG